MLGTPTKQMKAKSEVERRNIFGDSHARKEGRRRNPPLHLYWLMWGFAFKIYALSPISFFSFRRSRFFSLRFLRSLPLPMSPLFSS